MAARRWPSCVMSQPVTVTPSMPRNVLYSAGLPTHTQLTGVLALSAAPDCHNASALSDNIPE